MVREPTVRTGTTDPTVEETFFFKYELFKEKL